MKDIPAILALMIPIVAIFSALVIRPWMRLHYESLQRGKLAMTVDEQEALTDLRIAAERMEARLVTLERILDTEAPGWRERA
jgi:phage shock protein B